ncbi:hypothetical protein LSTR_LSTR017408 [Laodelphax striatellus]|uniref:Molybdate-anion transporter n=1 Tax=Laodelphax striatellus TaxID=195883 RepID=A0A482XHN9_LAOST|nr:hypothetical protein LSTR_LSTR014090 [Laodelphax striatellus]RZF47628.1 hypothetical protein LSTR_LSTR017408 [Laodelphax striatellus]
MIFYGTITVLLLLSAGLVKKVESANIDIENHEFKKLQNRYLFAFYLAAFSDWLQGPYIYQLYHDYGYDEDMIAVLYIAGFASSSVFGSVVGYMADRFGRKLLCVLYGLLYAMCCLTKLSPDFYTLLIGRILGGISTSILFSAFEAWYVNEHVNFFNFPPEWLNSTYSKASFVSGFLAIIAGLVADALVTGLDLGSVAPFLAAIPFLLVSSLFILLVWKEHTNPPTKNDDEFLVFSSLKLMFYHDRILLLLGFIQSAFESVMYIFIFSWTPVLSSLKPPLGLVFAIFMIAYMMGSKFYKLFTSRRFRPEILLLVTCLFSLACFILITFALTSILFLNLQDVKIPVTICYFCFILYEVSIGMYFPVMGYLRSRVIDEKYRASVTNWFRFPMNLFTCLGLVISFGSHNNFENAQGFLYSRKFPLIFGTCSILLLAMTFVCAIFCKKYSQKMRFLEPNNPVVAIEELDTMVRLKGVVKKDSDSIESQLNREEKV